MVMLELVVTSEAMKITTNQEHNRRSAEVEGALPNSLDMRQLYGELSIYTRISSTWDSILKQEVHVHDMLLTCHMVMST